MFLLDEDFGIVSMNAQAEYWLAEIAGDEAVDDLELPLAVAAAARRALFSHEAGGVPSLTTRCGLPVASG